MATKPNAPTDSAGAADSSKPRRDVLTVAMLAIAALVSVAGFAAFFSRWWGAGISDPVEVLRIASQEFVAGHPVVAGDLAETVSFPFEPDSDLPAEDEMEMAAAAPPSTDGTAGNADEEAAAAAEVAERAQWIQLRDFLVGAGKFTRAGEATEPRLRRELLTESLEPLEASRQGGFPPGRQTQGHRMLGEAYYRLGRYGDAIESLQIAASRDPTLARELLPIIAVSQLRAGGPWVEQSLATIDRHLSDSSLQKAARSEGQKIRIRALIALKQYAQANQAIERVLAIPITEDVRRQAEEVESRDEFYLLSAVSNIQEAIDLYGPRPEDPLEDRTAVVDRLAETIDLLDELQREAAPRTSARARLWSARAFLVQGWDDDALTRLTSVRQLRPFGTESILGGLEEIELLAEKGRGVEMLQTARYMMREIGDETGFVIGDISFQEFQRRMFQAIERLRRTGDFSNAIDTARSLPPVVDLSDALIQEAQGYSEWAAATLESGTDINGEVARSASELARSRYRASGDAFAQAAKLRFDTDGYLSAQWSAIEAYQNGRHFLRSIRLLEPYLRYEQRRRQPRALIAYVKALLAEGDETKAIRAAETCIVEYPRDPLQYDARLLAAMAHAERREMDKARQYLLANLRDKDLTPQSPAWRDSLFTLGELLFEKAYEDDLNAQAADPTERFELLRANQSTLGEAVRYLDEAAARYEDSPRAESAAYMSAQAHVLASRWPRLESESPEILEAAKRSLRAQADQELEIAIDGFVRLQKKLVAREEELRLPPKDQAILRNCFMGEADVLREMGRLDEAATVYRGIELRYMNEPLALEAIMGRARCAADLGRSRESNQLMRQAAIVLQRIPQEYDDRFAETTRFDREGWQEYLGWMNERIRNGGV